MRPRFGPAVRRAVKQSDMISVTKRANDVAVGARSNIKRRSRRVVDATDVASVRNGARQRNHGGECEFRPHRVPDIVVVPRPNPEDHAAFWGVPAEGHPHSKKR